MFAKVFTQILDSSLAEDYKVRLVFEDFLKLSDSTGVVDMTRESIARRTNVPLDIVKYGIEQLEKPDRTSRTPDSEGRRIIRLDAHRDWGWRIVNFTKYRESASKAMLRMAETERKAEYRKRYPKGSSSTPPTPKQIQSTEAEADMSQLCPGQDGTITKIASKKAFSIPTIEEITLNCQKIGLPETEAIRFQSHYESNGWKVGKNPMRSWTAAMTTWKSNYQQGTYASNRSNPASNPRNNNSNAGRASLYAHVGKVVRLPVPDAGQSAVIGGT